MVSKVKVSQRQQSHKETLVVLKQCFLFEVFQLISEEDEKV